MGLKLKIYNLRSNQLRVFNLKSILKNRGSCLLTFNQQMSLFSCILKMKVKKHMLLSYWKKYIYRSRLRWLSIVI